LFRFEFSFYKLAQAADIIDQEKKYQERFGYKCDEKRNKQYCPDGKPKIEKNACKHSCKDKDGISPPSVFEPGKEFFIFFCRQPPYCLINIQVHQQEQDTDND